MSKRSPTEIELNDTVGEFVREAHDSEEYLTIHFSPSSRSRRRRWHNYGLSADFLGDYFATFFPGDQLTEGAIGRREQVKAVVSFIANELIENAMKYGDPDTSLPVSISLYLYDKYLVLYVTNSSRRDVALTYRDFAAEVISLGAKAAYARQIERLAQGEDGSQMGIVTAMHDYNIRLAWQFAPIPGQGDQVSVSVMARMEV